MEVSTVSSTIVVNGVATTFEAFMEEGLCSFRSFSESTALARSTIGFNMRFGLCSPICHDRLERSHRGIGLRTGRTARAGDITTARAERCGQGP